MAGSSYGGDGKVNILIFPAGAENRMDIYDSLRHERNFDVYGASAKVDHGKTIYPSDHYYIGPLNISDPTFLEQFNDLIHRFHIHFVIPTHDTVAVYLTRMAESIDAGILCSPYETARIAENKGLTAKALQGATYGPRVYDLGEDIDRYPVFLKPLIGAGSRDTFLARSREELLSILERKPTLLISEYLPGREYTVSCFTSREGKILFAGASTRDRILNGRAYHIQRAEKREEFQHIAEDLNRRFVFRGSWFFQVKEDEAGQLKLMEFSVRPIGEMALYWQLGVNFAALTVQDAMGRDIKILFNDLELAMDLRFSSHYDFNYSYDTVYLDGEALLDGAGKVDPEVIRFAYQAMGSGKKLVLLTPMGVPAAEWLKRYPIHPDLFYRTEEIDENLRWSLIMDKNRSVFISPDRDFRMQVMDQCRIPVFDVDAIECLVFSNGS